MAVYDGPSRGVRTLVRQIFPPSWACGSHSRLSKPSSPTQANGHRQLMQRHTVVYQAVRPVPRLIITFSSYVPKPWTSFKCAPYYGAESLSAMLDVFFFSSRRRHTIFDCDWSSDVCSSDLQPPGPDAGGGTRLAVRARGLGQVVEAVAEAFLVAVLDDAGAGLGALVAVAVPEIGRASCRERV